jgi:hypothetical protein
MRPRALVQPPGWPDFMSRVRVVPAGQVWLTGRAWSGEAPVTRVEVTVDGGSTWADAMLAEDAGAPWIWRGWAYDWRPAPGRYVIGARATDAYGQSQPDEQPWNRGGFANNLVQRVDVVVR